MDQFSYTVNWLKPFGDKAGLSLNRHFKYSE
jgi:hypothetical protein